MKYWLLKSEPDVWSIDQQKKAGIKGATWDGISTNCLKGIKYNYEILENCHDEKFILEKVRQYQKNGTVKINLK